MVKTNSPAELRLLIVEDDDLTRKNLKDFFAIIQEPSFAVQAVNNGLEAWASLTEWKPDLLLLDIKMPIKDGIELTRELRVSGRKIPTVVLTHALHPDEILELRRLGVSHFVEKGSSESDFFSVRNILIESLEC